MTDKNYANLDIKGLNEAIRRLPPVKSARRNTKRHLIEQLRESLLDALLTRGYTYAKLADWLREQGITVHVHTLRKYLGPRSAHRNGPAPAPAPVSRPAPPVPPRDPPAAVTPAWVHTSQAPPTPGRPTDSPGWPARASTRPAGRFTPPPDIPLDKL